MPAQITAKFTGLKTSVKLQQRAGRLSQYINQVETQNAQAIKSRAISLSMGQFKTPALQQMARKLNAGFGLYSRSSPMPPAPAYVINHQSGQFAASWFVTVHVDADGTQIKLLNSSPHAQEILGEGGRRNMIPRPLLQKVLELENPARLQRLNDAKKRAMK